MWCRKFVVLWCLFSPWAQAARLPRPFLKCALALSVAGGAVEAGFRAWPVVERGTRSHYPRWQGEERLRFGKLTPFWAAEVTGTDLLSEDWVRQNEGPTVDVGILDLGFSRENLNAERLSPQALIAPPQEDGSSGHGTAVASVLFGPGRIGMARAGRLVMALRPAQIMKNERGVSLLAFGLDLMRLDPKLRLVVVPADLGDSPDERARVQKLVAAGKTVVLGVPNGRDVRSPAEWLSKAVLGEGAIPDASLEAPGIYVASLSPTGLPSDFARPHPRLAALAPSDHFLQSKFQPSGRSRDDFAYNSGATAVTGAALTYALARKPDLRPAEVEILLRATSLKLEGLDEKWGSLGVVNALRMEAVARKLRYQRFGSAEEFQKALEALSFEEDAARFLNEGLKLISQASLSEKLKGENLVRRSLLLHPTAPARAALVKFYEEQGLSDNAAFWSRVRVEGAKPLLAQSSDPAQSF